MLSHLIKSLKKNLLSSRFFLFYGTLWIVFIVIQGILRIAVSLSFQDVRLGEIWYSGLLQDISWSSYGLILILMIGLISGKLGEKLALFSWFLITVSTNFADFILLRQWGSRINYQALFYLKNPSEAFASLSFANWIILVIVIFLVFGFAYWGYSKLSKLIYPEYKSAPFKIVIFCAFLAITARGGLGKSPLTIENAMRFNTNFENQLALNSSWNFMYSLIQGNQIPDVSHFKDSSFFDTTYYYKLFPKSENDSIKLQKTRPHIILIVLEGLSAELSHFFNGKIAAVTPNLDHIAQEGLAFTHAYATGDRTDKGLVSIFSGWPGHPWQGMLAFPEKSSQLPNIISDLKSLNYHTSFYYGSDLHFANQRYYFEQSGIDEIHDLNSLSTKTKYNLGSWGIQDADMLQVISKRFLTSSNNENPQFISLLTLSTHDPYDAVPNNRGSDKQKMIRTAKYLDHELGEFFRKIKKSNKYQNTLVVLVSDHGKNLGSQQTNFGQKDFFHIPIIFAGGALKSTFRNKRIDYTISQTDIYSTMFHLMGWSQNEIRNEKLFPKGNRSLLRYSRPALEANHPRFAWFNIPGVTGLINDEGVFWLGTDKVSIDAEKPLNKEDSSILNLSTVIVNDFFNLK